MDLREYEQIKFELAAILRSAELVARCEHPDEPQAFNMLFARLAEDRFNLVVVGRFNRGKTSLMNAMLSTDRLPVGVLPLTSVITTVSYGTDEQAIIEYEGRGIPERVALGALVDYVTECGNPGNVRRVMTARVELPSDLLRRGFYFIDTPGLGSSILENTRTTERFLSEADAIVLVTSYDSPLSEEEAKLLEAMGSSGRRIFLVINKQDTVSEEARSEILNHIRQRIRIFGATPPQVFSVSARLALEADGLADNRQRRVESGVDFLEEQLVRFLVEEKQSEFIHAMCQRVADALSGLANCGAELNRLNALRRRIAHGRLDRPQAETTLASGIAAATGAGRFSGCEICIQIGHAIFEFLSRYQHELVSSEDARVEFAESGGFCEIHTWHYDAVASPRGTCIGFPELLEQLAVRLREIAAARRCGVLSEEIASLGPAPETCDVCRVQLQVEGTALGEMVAALVGDQTSASQRFSGLCLSHFRALIARTQDSDARQLMIAQANVLERISEDMHRYVVKCDGRRQFSTEEKNADQYGLMLLAGHRGINGVQRQKMLG